MLGWKWNKYNNFWLFLHFFIYKNLRNVQEKRNLCSHLNAGNQELTNYYKQATINLFLYIVVISTRECCCWVKYISHLFNTPHTVVTYFENTSRTLIDGELDGHTHFDGMFIKSMTMSDSRVTPSPIHHTEGENYTIN